MNPSTNEDDRYHYAPSRTNKDDRPQIQGSPEKEGRSSGRIYKHETDRRVNDKTAQLFAVRVDSSISDVHGSEKSKTHSKESDPLESSELKKKRIPSEEALYSSQESNISSTAPPSKRRRVQSENPCLAIDRNLASANEVGEIIAIFSKEKDHFNHVNIATACIQLAKLHKGGLTEEIENILSQLASSAVLKIGEFDARAIANMALSFAKLGLRNDQLFTALAREALHKIRHFAAQEIAKTACGFAKLGIRNDQLFTALAREAVDNLRHLNAQEIANIAWSFATLGIRNDLLFPALTSEAIQKVRYFNAQEIAKTAWSFATLGIRNDQLFTAFAREAVHKLWHFTRQDIANTVWAFTKLEIPDGELFAAFNSAAAHITQE